MAGITSLGTGSGIDIRKIVDGLVAAERQPQELQFTKQETDLQAKLSSFGTFKSSLSSFRASLAGLRDSSKFVALKATSSDSSVISASASGNADVGKFNLESKQLAQAHGLASAGFASASATVGTGTLTIKFGTTTYNSTTDVYGGFSQNGNKGTLTLTVNDTNNTLTGLRDAINKANAGVNASVIYDGGQYRLALTSTDTGLANSMQISVSDPGLSAFQFDTGATNMTQTQVAQDAVLSVNGLDVTSSTNSFKNTLKGVTLDLAKAQLGQKISLDVAKSSADAVSALQGFVKSYNELVAGVKELSNYDVKTKKGSVLLGDATLRNAMSQVQNVLGSVVDGLQGASYKTLVDLGLKTAADGTLALDSSKLNSALTADPNAVAAVFSAIGLPDNSKVQFFSNAKETLAGSYAVNVSLAATQGVLSGSNTSVASFEVLSANDPLDPLRVKNDTFKIKVDGTTSADIVLTAGSYANGDALAAEIQAKINGDSALKAAGAAVQVAYDSANARFSITSKSYGANSKVEITSSIAGNIGLASAVGDPGVDMAGTINGTAAESNGQYLTAANGLKLLIENGASGNLGVVKFSRGLMEKLDNVLEGLLSGKGTLTAKTDGLQKSLDLITKERERLNTRVADYEKLLLNKFNAMDSMLGKIQSTGSFLTSQLASLPYNNLSKSK